MSNLLSGILQSQAPPKQDATSTIQTLCLRLSSSTLLEDRRAAIMGLRSFAREYKESVASGGLRSLIGTLSKDAEDVDTIKVVLETLLLLFVKDESNPESSEDIALWLTDEFTQKQENITVLIDLLEDHDFYTRLYTLQLLVAILNNRPSRTQECIISAPLGISRLVSILDDKRDAIRNESILLVINLSTNHTDIQKLIAFENAFDRVFSIIDLETGIDGGIVVQDCLQLLSNLLSFNVSNQSYFRETGCIPRLAKLFDIGAGEDVAPYAREQRSQNIIYALRVCRLFVVPGGLGTPANQDAFFNAGILHLVLDIAFSAYNDLAVRAEALKAAADLIHSNAYLQESFAQMKVDYLNPSLTPEQQAQQYNPDDKCYVIEGLLECALLTSSIHAFDARLAACSCLEAYFAGNQPVRMHFLTHAINLHNQGDDAANILACLINLDSESRGDPYRVWLASVILLHLVYSDPEAKALATSVVEGDSEAGEEVVTAIQNISANLIAALQHNYDPRISIGYLMLLCVWLYEDSDAVDDFLSEGASVQSLVGAVTQSSGSNILVQGLCAFLLGILYEFSHRDSPIPRATLHPILASRMGRDHYINKITKLRQDPIVRDFEVSRDEDPSLFQRRKTGLPDVFFDHTFVDFLKDNYSRVLRAIDKDPGLATHIAPNGVNPLPHGISVELVESLKAQIEDKEEAISKAQTTVLTLEQKISEVQHESQRAKETAAAEIQRHKDAANALRRKYEAEAAAAVDQATTAIKDLQTQISQIRHSSEEKARSAQQVAEKEIELIRRQSESLRKTLQEKADSDLSSLEQKHLSSAAAAEESHQAAIKSLQSQITLLRQESSEALANANKASTTTIKTLESQLHQTRREAEESTRSLKETHDKDLFTLKQRLTNLTDQLDSAKKQHSQDLQTADRENKSRVSELENRARKAEDKLKALEHEAKSRDEELKRALVEKKEVEAAREQVRAELDDLLMVLGDLEEKRRADKERLKALGEEVSDDDEDEDEDEDEVE